jgi:mRNA interferase RelE/StbE
MSYEVFILRRAQKELAALPKTDYERLRDAIAALAENPRPAGCKKLTGR